MPSRLPTVLVYYITSLSNAVLPYFVSALYNEMMLKEQKMRLIT